MNVESESQNVKFEREPEEQTNTKKSWGTCLTIIILSLTLFLGAVFYLVQFLKTPPTNFPINHIFTIESGTSLRSAIDQVKSAGFVRSEIALYAVMMFEHKNDSIKASTYYFPQPLTLQEIANELVSGGKRSDLIKITNIEGETVMQMAMRAAKNLPIFDPDKFLALAKPYEGKLFPETYLVPSDFTAEELFSLLLKTFDEKIAVYEEDILKHQLTMDEIIILASILEREANSPESKRIVSGILQKRLAISMPLQVDASLEYILNKPLADLNADDLDSDSPYNTYLNYGLPPTAIGNPGLEAILAVLYPEQSDYLFYITGDDGNFYYAKNFEAHRANIAKYLR